MSWLFSQALVAEYSEAISLGGEPSQPLSSTPTPQAYWSPGRTTDFCPRSPSGMTFVPLTADRGADVLTSYLAGFRARTSASPERAQGSAESVPGSGRKWLASWAKYDPASSTWKTAQLSFLEDLGESSVTWPRSGLMRRGECYPLRTLEHITSESASGSLLPTLVADDTSSRSKPYAQGGTPLSLAVKLLPTLTVCGNYNRKGASPTSGDGLGTAIKKLRTLCASDADKWSNQTEEERLAKGQQIRVNHQLGGGPLNPTWCEWFMGFPLEWTALKPLAMPKFLEWQQQHSLSSPNTFSEAA